MSASEAARRELAARELARRDLAWFVKYTFPNYDITEFHKNYLSVLDAFAKRQIKNLIVSVPPQHGKTEIASIRLPSYLFGINPDLKIAIASYNTTYARKFNRHIQRAIDCNEYKNVFPDTMLNSSNITTVSRGYLRNADEFEIVNNSGSLKVVGRGGPLTGSPVDIMIMDDLYKDYAEANSPIIRDSVIDWYNTVVTTRLHNNSQQLIVFTRWHDEDLVGWLEQHQQVRTITSLDVFDPDFTGWYKVNFEAIKQSEKTGIDTRDIGAPLWPNRHSIERLEAIRSQDTEKFQSLYQGDPRPAEGLLYSGFNTYSEIPTHNGIKNYTDTADTGPDMLCSINYAVGQNGMIYVTDVLYTNEPMEQTEQKTANMLINGRVNKSDIESNSGGRGFSRNVERIIQSKGYQCLISAFHQSDNKESRILSNSSNVQAKILFPEGWYSMWPQFAMDLLHFKKLFKANRHDDAPDALTGVWEKSGLNTRASSGPTYFLIG